MVEFRKAHLVVLAGLAVAGCPGVPPEPIVPEITPQPVVEEALPEPVDLATWDQAALYTGWRAVGVLTADALGPDDEPIGIVEDIVVGPDAMIRAFVVRANGALDAGDVGLYVPWEEVTLDPEAEAARVPVTADTVELYRVPPETVAPPEAFRAAAFMGDVVNLQDVPGYGMVDDLIFSPEGELLAVVVVPDPAHAAAFGYPIGTAHAFPYYGFGFGHQPGLDALDLPHTAPEVAGHRPFTFDLAAPGR